MKPMLVRRCFAGFTAMMSVVVAAASTAVMFASVSPAHAAPAACSPWQGKRQLSVSPGAQLLSASDADLDRELTAARQMGAWNVRFDVDWSVVEPVPGQRNWSRIDRVVNAITAKGMCPYGLVTYAPQWAARPSDFPTNSHFRPADPNRFAGFAADAARRYAGSIAVWEVWNEPNLASFWRPRADVTEYGTLLRATSAAIKAAVPSAAVVSAGLAPATNNGSDIEPVRFVTGLYDGGFNTSFDALGMHPYCYPALPNDQSTASWNTALKLWPIHDLMAARGDGGKPIWVTEFGAPTGTSPVAVSPDDQLKTFQIAIDAQRGTPWLGPIFVYSVRDSGTSLSDPEQNFGVLQRDWSPKPAYTWFANQSAIG